MHTKHTPNWSSAYLKKLGDGSVTKEQFLAGHGHYDPEQLEKVWNDAQPVKAAPKKQAAAPEEKS